MTETTKPSEETQRAVAAMRDLRLDSIILWECGVQRGGATSISIGDVRAKVGLEHAIGEDRELQYTVNGSYEFINEDDELIATITSSFVVEYRYAGDLDLLQQVANQFARSVIMQVTPFQRELLSTLTNRLGMPPFHLPLMRRSDLQVEPE